METAKNLLKAMAGESLARNKYSYFAEQAEKEGLVWISRVFLETADNERVHAQEEFEQIKEKAEMTNTYGIDPQASTLENLRNAAAGEKFEYTEMYPGFKKVAEEEGDEKAAKLFQEISEVEEKHEERYNILADLLEADKLYKSDSEIEWKCLNCGYIHKGTEAPDKCPLCSKPQGWYMGIGIIR